MEYLAQARKIERDENYRHLVGAVRKRVHERVLNAGGHGAGRDEIKQIVTGELAVDGVSEELESYAEGFVRGFFERGSPYEGKHIHLGYSAGMVPGRAARQAEGLPERWGGRR